MGTLGSAIRCVSGDRSLILRDEQSVLHRPPVRDFSSWYWFSPVVIAETMLPAAPKATQDRISPLGGRPDCSFTIVFECIRFRVGRPDRF
jgi:hypothetical protein